MKSPHEFPIHDAEFDSIAVDPTTDGSLKLQIAIRVHEDEPLDELAHFGLTQRSCRLVFEKCWHVSANLFGFYSRGEAIDRWEMVSGSDLIRHIREMGCGGSIAFEHHRLIFTGGSTLDVLAERVSFTPLDVVVKP